MKAVKSFAESTTPPQLTLIPSNLPNEGGPGAPDPRVRRGRRGPLYVSVRLGSPGFESPRVRDTPDDRSYPLARYSLLRLFSCFARASSV